MENVNENGNVNGSFTDFESEPRAFLDLGEDFSFTEYQRERRERWQRKLDRQAEGFAAYEAQEASRRFERMNPEPAVPVVDEAREEVIDEETEYNARLHDEGIGIFELKEPPSEWLLELHNEMELLKQERLNEEFSLRLLNPTQDLKSRTKTEFFPHPVNLCRLLNEKLACKTKLMLLPPAVAWNDQPRAKRSFSLGKDMIPLLKKHCWASFKVTTDYTTLFCYPILLGALSGYFVDKVQQVELYLPPCIVKTDAFVRAYRWLLEPLTALMLSQLMELMRTAGFMDIGQLREQCWVELCVLMNKPELVYTIYDMAKQQCINLHKRMVPYLSNIFMPFVASDDFLDFKFEQVIKIFKLTHVAVNSEMEVFYAMLLWLDHDWEHRQRYTLQLFSCIHLEMMPWSFLVSFRRRTDCPPAMATLHNDALEMRICKIMTALEQSSYKYKGDIANQKRQWIYDSGCAYHHCTACDAMRFVSYSDFIGYLDFLQSSGYPSHTRIKPANDPGIVCCRPR